MHASRASLFQDFGNCSSSNGSTAFADRKTHPFFHRNRMDQFRCQFNVIARHNHLGSGRQLHSSRYVCRAEDRTEDDTL